jgi:multiple sugar transport system ATP-binding protein
VVLTERLGRSVELSVDVGGVSVIAVTDDQHVREGAEITLAIDRHKIHLFDGAGMRTGGLA